MLYTKSKEVLSDSDFRDPGSCYRGAPFWSWNCMITKEMIDEQIGYFKEMGMGGFHIHVRVGLKNRYLDDEFMELVRYCDRKAKENGLLCWLYDEDRYASGIAGGEVTKKVAFRARSLQLTTHKRDDITDSREEYLEKQKRNEKTAGCLLKIYDVVLEEGCLKEFRMHEPLKTPGEVRGTIWYLYEVMEKETPWCNNQTYADTLNEDAVREFITKTHEKYAAVLQEEFGKSVPAIFTDEPHISGMSLSESAIGRESIGLPFTEKRRPLHAPEEVVIHLKGCWLAEKYDTLTGERKTLNAGYEKGNTLLRYSLYGDDSRLLHLEPVKDVMKAQNENMTESSCICGASPNISQKDISAAGTGQEYRISRPAGYSTEEPNVLLLDKFRYALEDEDYSEECELLRADNDLRRRLGYPLRMEHVEQPYVRKLPDSREHLVRLKTTIYSRVAAEGCFLALEEPEYYQGTLNGEEICMEPVGYYVDRAIRTVALPKLREGENELVLYLQYGNASNLEWMYLLGEFGVRLLGAFKELVQKPDRLYWGDYTSQGYPFYTGNMVYYFELSCEKETDLSIQIPYYAGAAVKLSVDGEPWKMAALLPCQCILRNMKKGCHRIAVTCLGHRYNGFGQLHMIGDDLVWMGPDSWRTENGSWTEEYQVRPMGVLSEPVVRELRSLS